MGRSLASVIRSEATKWYRQSLSHDRVMGGSACAIFCGPWFEGNAGLQKLERLDVGGLLALGTGRDVEADTLAFLQGLEATGVDC